MANTTTAGPSLPGLTPDLQELIRSTALELGIDPVDLAMAMNYETIQTFDPDKWGGTGGNYLGLIQFGPQEQRDFGVYPGMPLGDQVAAAGRFLRQRGVEPGMGILDIYSAINAGSVGLYDRSDRIDPNTGRPVTVADHVAFNIEPTRESIAAAMLTPGELAEAELPFGTYLNPGSLPPWAYDPTPSVATVPLNFLAPPPPPPYPNPTRLATPAMPASIPLPRPRPDPSPPFANPAYPSLTGRARVLW